MYFKLVAVLLTSLVSLSLTGCGSSSNGAANSPFSQTGTSGQKEVIFGNLSTATGITGITVTPDRPTIDVDNGQVLVTAKVIQNDVAVPGVPVKFAITAPVNGPATIEAGLTTVNTDSNGVAVTRITAGNWPITTNIIVQATATIGKYSATATTTFQIVRGGGVIMFTNEAGLKPGEQTNMLEPWSREDVDSTIAPRVNVLQLLPFKVTDSNGNPRVGVPITLSVYSITSLNPGDVTVDFLVSPVTEPNQRTITTDSAGMGIFNVAVTLVTPPPGSFTAASVVFKAVTNDAIPVTAYVGGTYSMTGKDPEPEPEPEPAGS